MSPLTTSAISIVFSIPSLITVTVLGARFISLVIASLVFPFDLLSRYFPIVINVSIVPADSKYKSCIYFVTSSKSLCPYPYPILYMANIP